jgi:hypothetical protein
VLGGLFLFIAAVLVWTVRDPSEATVTSPAAQPAVSGGAVA